MKLQPRHTHRRHDNIHTSGSLRRGRPDVLAQSGPPLEDRPQAPVWGVWAGRRMKSPSVAGVGGAARSLLTARACWTMDSPMEDAMASESTRMWCVAKSRVAMRDAPYVVPSRWPLTLDLGARAEEPKQCGHGGVERAGHLRDQHPHLAAVGKRIGILARVRRDVTSARRVVEGAVRLYATLCAAQRRAADVFARAAEGVRVAGAARRLAADRKRVV